MKYHRTAISATIVLFLSMILPQLTVLAAPEPSRFVLTVDGENESGAVLGVLHDNDPTRARLGVKNRHKFWTNIVIQQNGSQLSPTALTDDLGGFYARFGAIGPEAEAVWDAQFSDTNTSLQIVTTTPGYAYSNSLTAGFLNILYGAMVILDGTGSPTKGSLANIAEAIKTVKGGKSMVAAAAALVEYPPNIQDFVTNFYDALTDEQQATAILKALSLLGLTATKAQLQQLAVIPNLVDAMSTVGDEISAIAHQSSAGSAVFATVPRPGDGWLRETHSLNILVPRDFKFSVDDSQGRVRVLVDGKLVIDTQSDCGSLGVIRLGFGDHTYQVEYRTEAGRVPVVSYHGAPFVPVACAAPSGDNTSGAQPGTDLRPPNPPTNLLIASATDQSINLTWQTKASNATGFKVYSDGKVVSTVTSTSATAQVQLSDLPATSPHCFSVIAYNGAGESPPSNDVCTNPLAVIPPTPQPPPTLLPPPTSQATLGPSATPKPTTRMIKGGPISGTSFVAYTVEVPSDWIDKHDVTPTADDLTLSKGGYTMTISQAAREYGKCAYDGAPPAQFSHTYGGYASIAGKDGHFRRSWDTDNTSGTIRYVICQQRNDDASFDSVTRYGGISIVGPNPPDPASLAQIDGMIVSLSAETSTPSAPPVPLPIASYQNVSFSYDPSLAKSVSGTTSPADTPAGLAHLAYPEHVLFTITGYPLAVPNFSPLALHVYPLREYAAISSRARGDSEKLRTLLANRPDLSALYSPPYIGDLRMSANPSPPPFLPHPNASIYFVAKPQYVDFQGGSGIRYITAIAGQQFPISQTNPTNFFYTFQGLTSDGNSYVSALFPVSVAVALDPSPSDATNVDLISAHNERVVAQLGQAANRDYTPDLDLLDALIKSLRITAQPIAQASSAPSVAWISPDQKIRLSYQQGWRAMRDATDQYSILELDTPNNGFVYLSEYVRGTSALQGIQGYKDRQLNRTDRRYTQGAIQQAQVAGQSAASMEFQSESKSNPSDTNTGITWYIDGPDRQFVVEAFSKGPTFRDRDEVNAIVNSIRFSPGSASVPAPTFIAVPPGYPPTPTTSLPDLKAKLIALMPVVTPEFSIEYYRSDDHFLVTVAQSPYDVNKAKADQWFRDHGVSDLSRFNIQYAKYRFVQ